VIRCEPRVIQLFRPEIGRRIVASSSLASTASPRGVRKRRRKTERRTTDAVSKRPGIAGSAMAQAPTIIGQTFRFNVKIPGLLHKK